MTTLTGTGVLRWNSSAPAISEIWMRGPRAAAGTLVIGAAIGAAILRGFAGEPERQHVAFRVGR